MVEEVPGLYIVELCLQEVGSTKKVLRYRLSYPSDSVPQRIMGKHSIDRFERKITVKNTNIILPRGLSINNIKCSGSTPLLNLNDAEIWLYKCPGRIERAHSCNSPIPPKVIDLIIE